ncbi:hypothetical protein [Streptomyces sp. CT34]|uniref:hypothetical protein n=1 Tax=Streptomyces sp. CT34 TaxID=1553907 RepID=UPI0005BAA908|nr:hypothetical protein [Streptomyces sp. CT34]
MSRASTTSTLRRGAATAADVASTPALGLVGPASGHDTPVPLGPRALEGEVVQPVFVDASGRRRRRVRRAAGLLMLPAGGYLALLVSTVLSGPALATASVPPSGPAPRPTASAPDTSPGPAHATGGPTGAKTAARSATAADRSRTAPT